MVQILLSLTLVDPANGIEEDKCTRSAKKKTIIWKYNLKLNYLTAVKKLLLNFKP